MTCDACSRAETNPHTGRFNAQCDGCAARALALSPDFHESRLHGRRTQRYEQALAAFFGGREGAGHQMAVEWFRRLRHGGKIDELRQL